MEDRGPAVGIADGETPVALELPTYADSVRPINLPGFTNPQYSVAEGRGEEEGEREGVDFDADDRPPPYSPGGFGQRDVYVAPPEYFAIFGQIREAREESTNHFVFLRKLCQILLNTIGCTVLLLIFMSIPIAILGVGVYFLGDCPTEPNIPVFLVVGGVSGALKNIALVFENIVKRTSHRFSVESARRLHYAKFVWRAVNLVFNLFLLAWIIAGSYWVYHIYREVDPDFEHCHETLYKISFGVITSSYILFAMMCCCMCVCGVCLLPRGSEENETAGEEGEGEGSREASHSPTPHSEPESSLPPPPEGTGVERESSSGENGAQVESDPVSPERAPVINGGDNGGRRHGDGRRQQTLSLEDLEPLDVGDYQQTPVLSPRARQLAANEQVPPLSPRTTSV